MSEANVQVIRDAYDALSGSGLSEFSQYWANDITWQTMRTRWRGRDAGRAYLQELLDMFDDFTTEVVDVRDAGGERVVVSLRYRGRSKLTGLPVPAEHFSVVTSIRDGQIVDAVEFESREEALAAVGLSE
jgi:ketosteroid isomerase-like protein